MLRLAFNKYFFAQFTLLKAQYIIPNPPANVKMQKQERFVTFQIQKEKDISSQEAKEIFISNKNELTQKYQKQYNEYLKTVEKNKAAIQKWKEEYDIPKKPVGIEIMLRQMMSKKFNLNFEGYSLPDHVKQINELMAKEKEQAEILREEAKKIYEKDFQTYIKKKEEYDKKYRIPQTRVVSLYQTYLMGQEFSNHDKNSFQSVVKNYKELSEDQQKELHKKTEQIQEENQKKLKQWSVQYGMSVEDLTKELKKQIKEYKEKNKDKKQKQKQKQME